MEIERRTIIIERAPPRRLAPGARWRSFKRGPDHLVWQTDTEPLRRLLHEGWRIQRVMVDWGKRKPHLNHLAGDDWIRSMTGAHPDAAVATQWSGQGRGRTTVELTRPTQGSSQYGK